MLSTAVFSVFMRARYSYPQYPQPLLLLLLKIYIILYIFDLIFNQMTRKELSTIMKLLCSKKDLLAGVNIVSKAVSNKTTLDILGCILVETQNGQIKLTGNDMELGIETIVNGKINEEGKIALDAKLFSEIVRKLPDSDAIYVETEPSGRTLIQCEKSNFQIMGRTGEDFTALPNIQKNTYITLSSFMLKEIIRQTLFSIAENDTNRIMSGELFEIKGNNFRIASLDGHRISIRNIELKEASDEIRVIVPGKALNELSKILSGENDDEVTIYFTEKHALFEMENTKVVSRLIEGNFFQIDQMLSTDYETKLRVNKKELYNCIDRATLFIKESDKKPIVLHISEQNMELSIHSMLGSMKADLDIYKQGKDILIGFNPKFLLDALKVIDDDEITLYLINSKAPCFIKDDDENYIYLILPININA